MLKFISHHLDTIAGIGIYPVLSFIVFFLFFLAVLWWVFTVRRAHIEHMAALPIAPEKPINEVDRHAN
jgi:cytochrome c oxidase cbb3-type subunit 4